MSSKWAHLQRLDDFIEQLESNFANEPFDKRALHDFVKKYKRSLYPQCSAQTKESRRCKRDTTGRTKAFCTQHLKKRAKRTEVDPAASGATYVGISETASICQAQVFEEEVNS